MQLNKRIIIPATVGFLLILLILFFLFFFRDKPGLTQNITDSGLISRSGSGNLQQSGILSGLSEEELLNLPLTEQSEIDLNDLFLTVQSDADLHNSILTEQSEINPHNLSQAEIELQLSMQLNRGGSDLLFSQSEAIEFNLNTSAVSITSLSDNVFLTLAPDGNRVLPADHNTAAIENAVLEPVVIPIPDYMILIRGGIYEMGSPDTEMERETDETLHNVNIRPFYISKFEVTQKLYEEIMKKNPSYFKGADHPVDNVSWFDAVEYCNALSRRDGLPPAYTISGMGENRVVSWDRSSLGYRLPTEAEWEFSCRAGTTTAYNTGNNMNRRYANYLGRGTRSVGSYPANRWGIYDMHGNLSEWCWDWYYDYSLMPLIDTNFANSDGHRIFRGGSWFNSSMRLRSAFRDHYYPSYRNISIGFRIARNYE